MTSQLATAEISTLPTSPTATSGSSRPPPELSRSRPIETLGAVSYEQKMESKSPAMIPHPLTKFTLFPKLPPELRCKIWDYIIHRPRLIQMQTFGEVDRLRREVLDLSHTHPLNFICVTDTSCQPPKILRICRESRLEALKSYKLVIFDRRERQEHNKRIYYNEEADVVYFGSLGRLSTMVYLFESGLSIPRVAINMEDTYKSHRVSKEDDITSTLSSTAGDDVVQTLHVLHGLDPANVTGNSLTWQGCSGLKEVTWVVHSSPWDIKPGHVDEDIGIQPMQCCRACSLKELPVDPFSNSVCPNCGLYAGKRDWESIRSQMEDLEAGKGLSGVGETSKWVGKNMPVFRYSNLFRSTVSDYLAAEIKRLSDYFLMRKATMKESGWKPNGQSVNVDVNGVSGSRPTEGTYVITIKGQRKAVEEAKKSIQWKLTAAKIAFSCA